MIVPVVFSIDVAPLHHLLIVMRVLNEERSVPVHLDDPIVGQVGLPARLIEYPRLTKAAATRVYRDVEASFLRAWACSPRGVWYLKTVLLVVELLEHLARH